MSMVRRMRICDISQDEAAMSTRLKIAFATSDMQHVNQHFGSARTFAVYAVDMESSELLEAAQFGELAQDGNEDKLSVKIDLLDGCAAVYCEAVGASAIRQIMAAGIQPVKVNRDSLIADLIEDFQNELKTGPSAWLAKAIARQNGADPSRFARMEAEGGGVKPAANRWVTTRASPLIRAKLSALRVHPTLHIHRNLGDNPMPNAALVVQADDTELQSDIVAELVKQMRALDTYDTQKDWPDARSSIPTC